MSSTNKDLLAIEYKKEINRKKDSLNIPLIHIPKDIEMRQEKSSLDNSSDFKAPLNTHEREFVPQEDININNINNKSNDVFKRNNKIRLTRSSYRNNNIRDSTKLNKVEFTDVNGNVNKDSNKKQIDFFNKYKYYNSGVINEDLKSANRLERDFQHKNFINSMTNLNSQDNLNNANNTSNPANLDNKLNSKINKNTQPRLLSNQEELELKKRGLINYINDKEPPPLPKFIKQQPSEIKCQEILELKRISPSIYYNNYYDDGILLAPRKFLLKIFSYISNFCYDIITHPIFDHFILFIIVINTIFIIVSDPNEIGSISDNTDEIFLYIFTLECTLKIFALGFLHNDDAYIREVWNILDFIVVILGWVTYILERTVGNSFSGLSALRTLRVLRPLKSIKSIPQLKNIIETLLLSFSHIADITIILFFFFLLCSIIGIQMFRGRLMYRCTNPETGHVSSYSDTLSTCTYDSDCNRYNSIYEQFSCMKNIYNPKDGLVSFDNVIDGIIVVIITATMEGWTGYFTLINRTFKDKTRINEGIIFLFFHLILFIGGYYLINLFLAVINSQYMDVEKQNHENKTKNKIEKKLINVLRETKRKRKVNTNKPNSKLNNKKKNEEKSNENRMIEELTKNTVFIRKNLKDLNVDYETIHDMFLLKTMNAEDKKELVDNILSMKEKIKEQFEIKEKEIRRRCNANDNLRDEFDVINENENFEDDEIVKMLKQKRKDAMTNAEIKNIGKHSNNKNMVNDVNDNEDNYNEDNENENMNNDALIDYDKSSKSESQLNQLAKLDLNCMNNMQHKNELNRNNISSNPNDNNKKIHINASNGSDNKIKNTNNSNDGKNKTINKNTDIFENTDLLNQYLKRQRIRKTKQNSLQASSLTDFSRKIKDISVFRNSKTMNINNISKFNNNNFSNETSHVNDIIKRNKPYTFIQGSIKENNDEFLDIQENNDNNNDDVIRMKENFNRNKEIFDFNDYNDNNNELNLIENKDLDSKQNLISKYINKEVNDNTENKEKNNKEINDVNCNNDNQILFSSVNLVSQNPLSQRNYNNNTNHSNDVNNEIQFIPKIKLSNKHGINTTNLLHINTLNFNLTLTKIISCLELYLIQKRDILSIDSDNSDYEDVDFLQTSTNNLLDSISDHTNSINTNNNNNNTYSISALADGRKITNKSKVEVFKFNSKAKKSNKHKSTPLIDNDDSSDLSKSNDYSSYSNDKSFSLVKDFLDKMDSSKRQGKNNKNFNVKRMSKSLGIVDIKKHSFIDLDYDENVVSEKEESGYESQKQNNEDSNYTYDSKNEKTSNLHKSGNKNKKHHTKMITNKDNKDNGKDLYKKRSRSFIYKDKKHRPSIDKKDNKEASNTNNIKTVKRDKTNNEVLGITDNNTDNIKYNIDNSLYNKHTITKLTYSLHRNENLNHDKMIEKLISYHLPSLVNGKKYNDSYDSNNSNDSLEKEEDVNKNTNTNKIKPNVSNKSINNKFILKKKLKEKESSAYSNFKENIISKGDYSNSDLLNSSNNNRILLNYSNDKDIIIYNKKIKEDLSYYVKRLKKYGKSNNNNTSSNINALISIHNNNGHENFADSKKKSISKSKYKYPLVISKEITKQIKDKRRESDIMQLPETLANDLYNINSKKIYDNSDNNNTHKLKLNLPEKILSYIQQKQLKQPSNKTHLQSFPQYYNYIYNIIDKDFSIKSDFSSKTNENIDSILKKKNQKNKNNSNKEDNKYNTFNKEINLPSYSYISYLKQTQIFDYNENVNHALYNLKGKMIDAMPKINVTDMKIKGFESSLYSTTVGYNSTSRVKSKKSTLSSFDNVSSGNTSNNNTKKKKNRDHNNDYNDNNDSSGFNNSLFNTSFYNYNYNTSSNLMNKTNNSLSTTAFFKSGMFDFTNVNLNKFSSKKGLFDFIIASKYEDLNKNFLNEYDLLPELHQMRVREKNYNRNKKNTSNVDIKSEVSRIHEFDFYTNSRKYVVWSGQDVLFNSHYEREKFVRLLQSDYAKEKYDCEGNLLSHFNNYDKKNKNSKDSKDYYDDECFVVSENNAANGSSNFNNDHNINSISINNQRNLNIQINKSVNINYKNNKNSNKAFNNRLFINNEKLCEYFSNQNDMNYNIYNDIREIASNNKINNINNNYNSLPLQATPLVQHKKNIDNEYSSFTSLEESHYSYWNKTLKKLENYDIILYNQKSFIRTLQIIRYYLYKLSYNRHFEFFIIFIVLINAIIMALDGNLLLPEQLADFDFTNNVFRVIFIIEFVIKILGMGPLLYFAEMFNYIDFIIVVFGIVEIVTENDSNSSTINFSKFSVLRVFRIFRVLRLMKVLRKMKSVRRVFTGISRAITNTSYILLILAIFIVIFQIFGNSLLNKSTFYNGFLNSFYSTFQLLTTENWNDIVYGLKKSVSSLSFIYLLIWIMIGNFVLFNLFLSVLLDSFNNEAEDDESILLTSNSNSDNSYPELFKKYEILDAEENIIINKKKLKNKNKKKLDEESQSDSEEENINNIMYNHTNANLSSELLSENEKKRIEKKIIRVIFKNNECEYSCFLFAQKNKLRVSLLRLINTQNFDNFILFIILLSTLRLIVESFIKVTSSKDVKIKDYIFDIFDCIINSIFILECTTKIFSMGFVLDKGSYLRDHWNKLDFVIVFISLFDYYSFIIKYMPNDDTVNNSISFLKVLRMLRILRPLRFISHNVKLKLIINSLFDSIISIINVFIIVIIVFFIFSIIGMNLFYDLYFDCYIDGTANTPEFDDLAVAEGVNISTNYRRYLNLVSSNIMIILLFYLYLYKCYELGGNWDSYPNFRYGNIIESMITSYVVAAIEGWPNIMSNYVS